MSTDRQTNRKAIDKSRFNTYTNTHTRSLAWYNRISFLSHKSYIRHICVGSEGYDDFVVYIITLYIYIYIYLSTLVNILNKSRFYWEADRKKRDDEKKETKKLAIISTTRIENTIEPIQKLNHWSLVISCQCDKNIVMPYLWCWWQWAANLFCWTTTV